MPSYVLTNTEDEAYRTTKKGKLRLIIPIEDSGMFLGEKGCYLNMTAIEMREARYNDTHCVKVSLPKEQYDAMTEEERNSTPILGGMHEIKASPKPIDTSAVVVDDDDLPF